MFAFRAAGALLFVLTLVSLLPAQENNRPPKGFVALFNGKDLAGWHGMGHFNPVKLAAMSEVARAAKRTEDLADMRRHWSVENGELVNDGHGVYLTTDKEYGDFELRIDYKTVAKADSGIYLRANPQVQIWDTTKEGKKWHLDAHLGSGGLWNNNPGAPGKNPLVLADKPFGEWNRLRIRQVGARTSVWLNGKRVVNHAIMDNFWDRSRAHFPKGPIQLQTHGGEIRWRNVFLKELSSKQANKILASHGEHKGFQSAFNGKDFEGWAGPTDNYTIEGGVVRCKPKSGGTIYTVEEYEDFVVRLEFKLPPHGNNGLAIRYPGKGDTAYVGMCELQVLDTEHPGYKGLDPRQAHGSAYGMVAATRGYLRPTGDWNFQEVTVRGSTIRVELNGSVILDADLKEVTDYLGKRPHPGKDRTRGHFGFAGHGDPVEFRNVRIRRLPTKAPRVRAVELGSVRNVHRVGQIYLAGQMEPADLAKLKKAGIRRVLDLRMPGEVSWDEPTEARAAGLSYQRLPFRAPDTLTPNIFDKARAAFAATTRSEPLICKCGSANRVGAVWLVHRVLDEGVDFEQALEEAKKVGLRTEGYVEQAKAYIEAKSK